VTALQLGIRAPHFQQRAGRGNADHADIRKPHRRPIGNCSSAERCVKPIQEPVCTNVDMVPFHRLATPNMHRMSASTTLIGVRAKIVRAVDDCDFPGQRGAGQMKAQSRRKAAARVLIDRGRGKDEQAGSLSHATDHSGMKHAD
jgi:hypothetical protein